MCLVGPGIWVDLCLAGLPCCLRACLALFTRSASPLALALAFAVHIQRQFLPFLAATRKTKLTLVHFPKRKAVSKEEEEEKSMAEDKALALKKQLADLAKQPSMVRNEYK